MDRKTIFGWVVSTKDTENQFLVGWLEERIPRGGSTTCKKKVRWAKFIPEHDWLFQGNKQMNHVEITICPSIRTPKIS